ncbi:hypothetical protein [Dyella telluris]|uniref:Uncharacterized protein n=1 Tax=Dyella telluris TaxID=2763498 RepID=A0A7G8Q2H6_9GAMM|nr:hypothetical protein [Dyella telluris]QNK00984.1 hypothetical protein H8F01_18225 [Dyella telluris]
MSPRTISDINDDLLAAACCISDLAHHISEHGPENVLVLNNLERATDGFKRLLIERRAVEAA